ncbi:MAG: hypothetical protein CMLOHMNK_02058 [Steroidobacteraceae bacterium]|nr:hypothetical protein [Steroidobacteraceae bacterium]
MTEADLHEIEQLANAATAGPWHNDAGDIATTPVWWEGWVVARCYGSEAGGLSLQEEADAHFIAAAREDVPALCAALRAAWAETARWEARVSILTETIKTMVVALDEAAIERGEEPVAPEWRKEETP